MKFRIIVKNQQDVLLDIEGREIDASSISLVDIGKLLEAEAFLEKMLGYRFHFESRNVGPEYNLDDVIKKAKGKL